MNLRDPQSAEPASRPPDAEGARPGRALLGTAALFAGTALLCLLTIDRTTGISFMPRSWHSDRALWTFFAVAGVVFGCLLLRHARSSEGDAPAEGDGSHDAGLDATSPSPSAWRSSRGGVRFGRVLLYTRDGCRLCDEAKQILLSHARYLPPLEEVDIDGDPQLVERFGTCVPVIEIDGRVRFRGRVNEVLLRRLIEGSRPFAS